MSIDKLNWLLYNTIPAVYDNSMSYYELLNAAMGKLNEVIDDVNLFTDDMEGYVDAQLKSWQADGTLTTIITNALQTDLGDITTLTTTDKISAVNAINEVNKKVGDVGAIVETNNVDDSSNLQTAINGFPSTGGTLILPSSVYHLGSDVSFNGKLVNIICHPSTSFTGSGKMPTNITNLQHNILQNYLVSTPNGGAVQKGNATLSSEISPTSDYIGNAVAGFFGAKSGAMAGSTWAVNAISKVDAGFTGFNNTVEIDTDNESSTAQRIQGLLISGLGSQNIYSGLTIDRADDSRNEHGIIIDKVLDGVTILNADNTGVLVQNTGLSGVLAENNNIGLEVSQAKTNGIFIHDMDTGHIKLKPLTDTNPDQAMIYGVNSGDSQVNWQVTKGGKGEFTGGLQIGGGTLIKNCISSAPTLTFPSVPANSTLEMSTNVAGVKVVDAVSSNPIATIGQGLMWSAYVSANDTVTIRIANVTSGALTPASVQWIINVLQIF